jgi:uncharacterized protein
MTGSSLLVFAASLLLTAIVGSFMAVAWSSARTARALTVFWGFALVVHLAWFSIPHLRQSAPVARWLSIMWLSSMLAAACLLIPVGVLAIGFQRRRTVSRFLPLIYTLAWLLSGVVLAITSTAPFVLRQEEIRIAGLPAGLDGFRIANLGDVHIGYFIDSKELLHGIEAINAQRVDLIAVTGDLVDDVSQLESTMRALEKGNAPYNTVAILGNHEESRDLGRIVSIYGQHSARITLLINQNVTLYKGGMPLHIAGVTYPRDPNGKPSRHPEMDDEEMNANADAAFAGLPRGDMIIALSHQPPFFAVAAARGARLTLASHTHGAQIRLFGRPLIGVYTFLQGLYQRGEAYLDVSAGFGHWLPVRFGVPREIVIVTLRRE